MRYAPEVTALQTAIDETVTAVFGHKTVEYNRYHGATKLDQGPIFVGHQASPPEVHRFLSEGKARAVLRFSLCTARRGGARGRGALPGED
jgi:hypothetical protein